MAGKKTRSEKDRRPVPQTRRTLGRTRADGQALFPVAPPKAELPNGYGDALNRSNVFALAQALPDVPQGSEHFIRCASAQQVPVATLTKVNSGRWVKYAANVSRTLRVHGIVMPVIATLPRVAG